MVAQILCRYGLLSHITAYISSLVYTSYTLHMLEVTGTNTYCR